MCNLEHVGLMELHHLYLVLLDQLAYLGSLDRMDMELLVLVLLEHLELVESSWQLSYTHK